MWKYILRRCVQAIPVIVGVALISFALSELSGDPIRGLLGQSTSPEIMRRVREFYGFDKPRPERFLLYMVNLLHGNLGASIANHGMPVTGMILAGMRVTVKLALGATIFATFFGTLSGVLSAWKPNSAIDYSSSVLSALGVSFPAFFLAMLLLVVFAVQLNWFPIGGYVEGQIKYMVLPCLSLGLISMASVARLSRNCVLEALSQDYIRSGRAKGLDYWTVLVAHALPNALVPLVTMIGGDFAGLLVGAVLTETVFDLPGLGSVLNNGIRQQDLPVVMGCCVFSAVLFVCMNLLVDILYAYLDPRIRHGD